MSVNKWVIIDASSASYKNRYLLKINGLRDDILNIFNQFINDCEVPFAIHNDKDFNWGLFYYDPNGKVSDKILKELTARFQEDQKSSESVDKQDYFVKNDLPQGREKTGQAEGPTKIEIISDFFSDFLHGDSEKKADKTVTAAETEQQLVVEAAEQKNDLDQEKQQKPIVEPPKEIDIYKKEPEITKQQEYIDKGIKPEPAPPVSRQKASFDEDMKGLMDELNSVLADLTQTEKKQVKDRIKTDWRDKIIEMKNRYTGNEAKKIKNEQPESPKPEEEEVQRKNDAEPAIDKEKQKSLDDVASFITKHADEIPVRHKQDIKIKEPLFKSPDKSMEIEDRAAEEAKLGQNAEKVPEEYLKSDVQLNEVPKDNESIKIEKVEKPKIEKINVELTNNADKAVQTPAEDRHAVEEIKKAPPVAEIREIPQYKPSRDEEPSVIREPVKFKVDEFDASNNAPQTEQEDSEIDIPITIKQSKPEPQDQPIETEEPADVQKPAAPQPPGTLDICCFFPKDESETMNQFSVTLNEVVEKTTKSKFVAHMSLKYPVDPENTDVENIMIEAEKQNFDLIVLIDVPAIPRMAVNNLSQKMKDAKKNFKIVSKNNVSKKFIYVDLVVDSVLKKNKM